MSPHTPAADRVADALTRVGSGVAAVVFVAAAALTVPLLLISLALTVLPSTMTTGEADFAALLAAVAAAALAVSLGLVALGRFMRPR